METLFELLRPIVALAGGLTIGCTFGLIQNAARRRLERKYAGDRLKNGWAIMPGSMTRVAIMLALLGLIQVVCPMFFVDGVQWWVSAGVALGYGAQLFTELRARRASLLGA